jgi:phosphopantetheine adenylyltransferase
MKISDNSYELDPRGNRVLIGLTAEETKELFRLDRIIAKTRSGATISSDEFLSENEQRWLELYEKHQAALEPFLKSSKTMH